MRSGIVLRPASWQEARAFIDTYHRHHKAPRGWRFGIAAECRGQLVGIATIGRPVSRVLAARGYLEVTRTCTILWGVNKLLLRAAAAAAEERSAPICTYTLASEHGGSLRAAGWVPVAIRTGRPSDWRTPARLRDTPIRESRVRWEPATLAR